MSFLTSFVAGRLCNRYDDSAEKRLKKDILHTYIYYILLLPEITPRSCLASPFPTTSHYISDPILTIVASVTTPEREHFLLSLSTLLTPGIPLFPHFGHIRHRLTEISTTCRSVVVSSERVGLPFALLCLPLPPPPPSLIPFGPSGPPGDRDRLYRITQIRCIIKVSLIASAVE